MITILYICNVDKTDKILYYEQRFYRGLMLFLRRPAVKVVVQGGGIWVMPEGETENI